MMQDTMVLKFPMDTHMTAAREKTGKKGAVSTGTAPDTTMALEQSIKGRSVGRTVLNHKRRPFFAPSRDREGFRSRRNRVLTAKSRRMDFFMADRI